MLPNTIFDLHLHIYALGIYAYLMRMEDRRTYQCVISYLTLAEKLGISVGSFHHPPAVPCRRTAFSTSCKEF